MIEGFKKIYINISHLLAYSTLVHERAILFK